MYPLKNLIFHDGNYQLFLERSDSNFFKKYTSQPTMTHLGTLKTCPYKYTAILCPIFWRKKKTAHTKKKKKYSLKEDDAQGVCKYQLKNWTSKSSSFSNPSLRTFASLFHS
ncbi:hypothetical protein HMI55_000292 [Coelomomyces lativittatus]|nr:hypothetical protein HMI55_000292 [Coelomomyces lativittatus]